MPLEGKPIGQHARICSLMTGVYNLRPPRVRFTVIWDVQQVLDHLNDLPNNQQLSVKLITHKLAILLALASASRGSEICALDTSKMINTQNKYTFLLKF